MRKSAFAVPLVVCAVFAAAAAAPPALAAGKANAVIVVNVTGDASDNAIHDGVCDTSTVTGLQCTFRAAIENANFRNGTDTIDFRISTGVQNILPNSPLPQVTGPVVIDGTTQPDQLVKHTCLQQQGHPCIVLTGRNVIDTGVGLHLSGGLSTVRGLVINEFPQGGILIDTAGSDTIAGNYIGTDVTGKHAIPNRGDGVEIVSTNGNHIGGTDPADRNVISGNGLKGVPNKRPPSGFGVDAEGISPNDTIVQGNFIGTDVTGTVAIGNLRGGILLNGSTDSTIGGTAAGAGNVISGNGSVDSENVETGFGVEITGTSSINDQVVGNRIGVDPLGNALPNLGPGIFITSGELGGASGNPVGGATPEAANVIAFNHGAGIRLSSNAGTGNAILGNSIHDNAGLGIDLGNDQAVTPNDPGDADTGPNDLQNFPVVRRAANGSNGSVIKVRLTSTPNTTFTVQLFTSGACDGSGFGEGKTLLAKAVVTTDGTGLGKFTKTISPALLPGNQITATATAPDGSTSEFSRCRAVS